MIKAEVKFTEKHFQALSNRRFGSGTWILYIMIFLWTGLTVFEILENGFNGDAVINLIVWTLIFGGLAFLRYFSSPKTQYKKYIKNFPNCTNIYRFSEEGITTETSSDTTGGNGDYSYVLVESAKEKNGFFIIRLKGIGSFIIGEHEITEGTPQEFRELLKEKLGKKFKQVK